MELRHLRCFVVLAEELHFSRASERLHIEQSPLSRTIKELEAELGAKLFDRDRRGTRLTPAGSVFLQDVRRLFATLDQAQDNVRALTHGYSGSLTIAVSEGATDYRLSDFLAFCRQEEPDIEIRLVEMPHSEQIRRLRSGEIGIGLAHSPHAGPDISVDVLWDSHLVAVLSARHPLLIHKHVPVEELARSTLIMCDVDSVDSGNRAISRVLRNLGLRTDFSAQAVSLEAMFMLVAAGYGIGFLSEAKVFPCKRTEIAVRRIASDAAILKTYLLRATSAAQSPLIERFTERLRKDFSAEKGRDADQV